MARPGQPLDAKVWMQIRTAYVVRGWSAQKCAEEFNVHATTIKTRAAKEGWTQERDRVATDATGAATDALKGAAAEVLTALRSQHAELVQRMHTILDGIAEDIAAMKPGRSRIEARRAAAEAGKVVLTTSRLVLGMTDGVSSLTDPNTEDSGERTIVFEEVEAEAETA